MTGESQRTVEQLTLATRILVNEGVIDGFGHVSARSAEHGDRYYMVCDNSVEAAAAGNFVELDSESNPVSSASGKPSIERFIHGEIYRARPDVGAIVHTHAPFLIPFGVSATPLQPLYHMCGFLARGVPVFDIARENGVTDMLVTDGQRGRSLARSLGKSALVLMRGHGATVVGSSIREAVFRAVYATVNQYRKHRDIFLAPVRSMAGVTARPPIYSSCLCGLAREGDGLAEWSRASLLP
jgi:ribulose-5-phosphate 4-epimerase/fuculose-1-phosphate aldolase